MGSVDRISPEAPVPVVWVQEERLKLGLAANVAENVQVLGGHPFLVGVAGNDRSGDDFRDLLTRAEISSQYCVVDASRRTIVKERVVSEQQQLLRIDYESLHFSAESRIDVERQAMEQVKAILDQGVDSILVEDYAKGFVTPELIQKTVALATEYGKPVWVDPNMKSKLSSYRGAAMLTPNRKEAEALTGSSDVQEAGRILIRETGARWAVITLGKDGMAVFENGRDGFDHVPTFAREVFDVSGAGDTVIATLALALSSPSGTLEVAVELANIAAGLVVGKRGTATVTVEEIRAAIEA